MQVDWSEFKNFIDSRNCDILKVEKGDNYYLFAHEENLSFECIIDKNASDETDLIEFETQYLPLCNPKRVMFDSSGKPMSRMAIASEGMILQCLAVMFSTAKKDSLFCKNYDNVTNKNYHTYKMLDVNGNETQVNAECVCTQIDFEPPFDYEMIGGNIFLKTDPTESIYSYLVALPDIPSQYGGSHSMCSGGFDLKFVNRFYKIDGRAPKMLYYDATLHTNKLRYLFYHSAGFQHDIMFAVECYK